MNLRVNWSGGREVRDGGVATTFDHVDELLLGRGRVLPRDLPNRFPATACIVKDRGPGEGGRRVEVSAWGAVEVSLRTPMNTWTAVTVGVATTLPARIRLADDLEVEVSALAAERPLSQDRTRAHPVIRLVPGARAGRIEATMNGTPRHVDVNATKLRVLWHLLEADAEGRPRAWTNAELTLAVTGETDKKAIERIKQTATRVVNEDLVALLDSVVQLTHNGWRPRPAPRLTGGLWGGGRTLTVPKNLVIVRGERPPV